MKARECLLELNTAQRLLSKPPPPTQTGDTGDATGTCCGGAAGSTGGGHDHGHANAHAHSHQGHDHHGRDEQACPAPRSSTGCAGSAVVGGDAGVKTRAGSGTTRAREEDAKRVAEGAMGVLQRAKVVCVVAEGDCLLRDGRAAQATEALRDLLLEVSGAV